MPGRFQRRLQRSRFGRFICDHPLFCAIVVAIIIVIVCFAVFTVNDNSSNRSSSLTEDDIVTSSQLEGVVNVDELSTAEFIYNGIAEQYGEDDDNVRYRVAYDATVKAGIQMSDVKFTIDEENKEVIPQLPAISITNVEIDVGSLDYMPTNPNADIKDVLELCEQDVRDEAKSSAKFYETAEENIRLVIEALTLPILENQGYVIDWPEAVQDK